MKVLNYPTCYTSRINQTILGKSNTTKQEYFDTDFYVLTYKINDTIFSFVFAVNSCTVLPIL